MNGTFYQNPTFPTIDNTLNDSNMSSSTLEDIPMQQSYIENILRLNKGKKVKAYVSYPDSSAWQNKIYDGIIEEAGRYHLIVSDPKTGLWYLIRLIYLDYVEFDERINYNPIYSEKTF